MRIKKLELKNFRGFEELTIDFPEGESGLAVFVGVNGCGKTSVIEGILDIMHLFYFNLLRAHYEENEEIVQFFGRRLVNESDIKSGADNLEINAKIEFEGFGEFDFTHKLNTNGSIESWPKPVSWMLDFDKSKTQLETELGAEKFFELKRTKELMVNNISFFKYYPTSRSPSKNPSLKVTNGTSYSRFNAFYSAFHNELNFDDFFEWFRNTEDHENENRLYNNPNYRHSGLEAIRKAFSIFIAQVQNPRIQRRPKEELIVEKKGEVILFNKLSDGEKQIFSLIGDIIRRMDLTYHLRQEIDLLKMPGIVIIDEIEQHLHPGWQRTIIPNLRRTFHNIQFILTTHSPQVLSSVPTENVSVLKDFKLRKFPPYHTEDKDSNSILEEVFELEARPEDGQKDLKTLYDLIDKNDRKKAEQKLEELKEKYGSTDSELVRAEMYVELMDE